MKRYRHLQKGFTLIEVMLVLAVLAALTVFGISAYEQKVMMTKVDKTTLQMQTIMQAAVSYYMQHKYLWPGDDGKHIYQDGMADLTNNGYIPATLNKNPWGGLYSAIADTGPNNQNKDDPVNFTVTTSIPVNVPRYKYVALLIRGKLPVIKVDDNHPEQVTAIVNLPPMASVVNLDKNFSYIAGVELKDLTDDKNNQKPQEVKDYPCLPGYVKDVEASINDFKAPDYDPNNPKKSELLWLQSAEAKVTKVQGVNGADDKYQVQIAGELYPQYRSGDYIPFYNGKALVITTCSQPNPNNSKTSASQDFKF